MEPHTHEWDEPIIEPDNGYIYVMQSCTWAEVVGSATSERLDETFYEYGAECDAQRSTDYLMSETVETEDGETLSISPESDHLTEAMEHVAQKLDIELEYEDDAYIALFNEAYEAAREEIESELVPFMDAEPPKSVEVEVEGMYVTFERERLDEDI